MVENHYSTMKFYSLQNRYLTDILGKPWTRRNGLSVWARRDRNFSVAWLDAL